MAPRFAFVPARWLAFDSPLAASDRLVLCVLCQWVNRERGDCFPSIGSIAGCAKLSENTVRKSLTALERAGALKIERGRRDRAGDCAPNLYTVLGFDPPRVGGGTAIQTPPPLQSGYRGGIRSVKRVLQSTAPNSVKENTALNTAERAPGDPDGPLRTRPYSGPATLHGLPIEKLPSDDELVPVEDLGSWRDTLRAAGAGPKSAANASAS